MTHREGPRPLIDGDEAIWFLRAVALIFVFIAGSFVAGALAGLVVLGFRLTSGG